MADPTRWAVLPRSAQAGACVCALQEDVPVAANRLSHHLEVLRGAGPVTATRRGRWVDHARAEDAVERRQAALPVIGSGGARR